MKRNRLVYSFLLLITILLGLLSRSGIIPEMIYPYLGDYLYALMWFLIVGLIFTKTEPLKVALISVLLCYFIECTQLSQADWINTIRSYKMGGLILGYGFLWSDMISYTLGGITGFLLEKANGINTPRRN
jgi:hypothetical protein